MSTPRAAVDVGSNSVRLLVVDEHGAPLTRRMTVTRLAAGMDRNGRFDDAALERTVAAIRGYAETWRAHGVPTPAVRVAATSAVRDAVDRARFVERVWEHTGVEVEVLSGADEAGYTFVGASGAVEARQPAAVVDVGGGSTELVVGRGDGRVAASASLQLGCVRLTERHLAHDPPDVDERQAARATVHDQLAHADALLGEDGVDLREAASLIAVAGTATTIAAVYLDLASYEPERIHGTRVPAGALRGIADRLMGLTSGERAGLGPMQPGREDVIHAGALILAELVDRLPVPEIVVSEADILDGLVATTRQRV